MLHMLFFRETDRKICSFRSEISDRWRRIWQADKSVFLSGIIFGLMAHLFMFSNKLINYDELSMMYTKGITVQSGRWGLELIRFIFPDYSMPWLYGLISIILITFAAWETIRIFDVQSTSLKILTAGIFVSFPAWTAAFCFMFTCAPYALALLVSVCAVRLFEKRTWASMAVSCLLLCFSAGIYQAFFAVSASFFIMLMIKSLLMHEKAPGKVFMDGVFRLTMLAVSLLLYLAITLISMRLLDCEFPAYAMNETPMLFRIMVAYSAFANTFLHGYFSFIRSGTDIIMHGLLLFVCTAMVMANEMQAKEWKSSALLALCLLLFPLSVYCLYIAASPANINPISLFSFTSVYILVGVVAELLERDKRFFGKSILVLALTIIMFSNIFFANKFYLKQHMEYENAYAFYTALSAQIKNTEGFDENSEVAFIGKNAMLVHDLDKHIKIEHFDLPGQTLMGSGNRGNVMQYILGQDLKYADPEKCREIAESEEFAKMPVYPYYGSVKEIDGVITVKFS